jgi:hypothetical protein
MKRYLPLIAFVVLAIAGCKGCHDQSAETVDAAVSEAPDAAAPTLAAPGAPAIPAQNTAHIQRNPDGTLSIVKDGQVKRLPKRILQNPRLMLPTAQTPAATTGPAPAAPAPQK